MGRTAKMALVPCLGSSDPRACAFRKFISFPESSSTAFLISQEVLVIGQLGSLSEPRGLSILHAVLPELQDFELTAAAAKSLQSCPTLCNPIDSSPPGSPVPGILQERTLEWVAVSFSNAWKWKMKVKSLSHVWVFATPWTGVYQAPLPMGFSR